MTTPRFVLVAFLVIAVVAVVTSALRKPDKKVAGPVTVVVPRRNLHDSGPANQGAVAATNPRRRTGRQPSAAGARTGTSRSGAARGSGGSRTAPPVKSPRRTGTKHKPVKTRPTRRPTQGSSQPVPPQPQPSPQPSPPPAVSVPLPSVCTKPIHVGTCP